jgi:hypothetical protein
MIDIGTLVFGGYVAVFAFWAGRISVRIPGPSAEHNFGLKVWGLADSVRFKRQFLPDGWSVSRKCAITKEGAEPVWMLITTEEPEL